MNTGSKQYVEIFKELSHSGEIELFIYNSYAIDQLEKIYNIICDSKDNINSVNSKISIGSGYRWVNQSEITLNEFLAIGGAIVSRVLLILKTLLEKISKLLNCDPNSLKTESDFIEQLKSYRFEPPQNWKKSYTDIKLHLENEVYKRIGRYEANLPNPSYGWNDCYYALLNDRLIYLCGELTELATSLVKSFNFNVALGCDDLQEDVTRFFSKDKKANKKRIKEKVQKTKDEVIKIVTEQKKFSNEQIKNKAIQIAKLILKLDDYIELNKVPEMSIRKAHTVISKCMLWLNNHGENINNSSIIETTAQLLQSQKTELEQCINNDKLTQSEKKAKTIGDKAATKLGKRLSIKPTNEKSLRAQNVQNYINKLEELIKPEENKKIN